MIKAVDGIGFAPAYFTVEQGNELRAAQRSETGESIMFAITNRAAVVLKTILENVKSRNNQCVRLDLFSAREGLRVDHEQVGDEVVVYEGKKVLAVDPYTAEKCAQKTLDCDGLRFMLVGPNL